MRKMLTNSFSERTLPGQEPVIESYMDLATARFRAMAVASDAKDAGVMLNMLDRLNYFTIDIVGDLGFRESFNCLRNSQYHDWVRTLHVFLRGMVFAAATRFYPSSVHSLRIASKEYHPTAKTISRVRQRANQQAPQHVGGSSRFHNSNHERQPRFQEHEP